MGDIGISWAKFSSLFIFASSNSSEKFKKTENRFYRVWKFDLEIETVAPCIKEAQFWDFECRKSP